MHQQSARPAPSAATFLHPAQVATVLQVSLETISRCLLLYQRTLGGHRRYPADAIEQLAASLVQEVRAS
jgi:hypothetical protein